jgi:hypothetical protein
MSVAKDQLITAWFYARKGNWRLRYLPTSSTTPSDPPHDPTS